MKKRLKLSLLSSLAIFSCLSISMPAIVTVSEAVLIDEYAEPAELTNDYVLYAQNDGASLYLNELDCVVAVRDPKGNIWQSTPTAVEEEEFEKGSIRMEMRSLLVAEYVNSTNSRFYANSRVSSVNQETFKINKITNGFLVTFDFSRDNEQFIIPLKCTLERGRLFFEIVAGKIEEYGTSRLLNIRIAPYFGASGVAEAEDGFVFVPDGSGAVMDFKDDRGWADSYRKMVYGDDPAHADYRFTLSHTAIHLPVFGMSVGDRGFTGIIEQGAALCFVEAIQPGYQSRFASVGVGFVYRQLDSRRLSDNTGNERLVYYQARYASNVNPRISYTFIQDTTGLADMAAVYRNYLIDIFGLSRTISPPRLTLEMIGATTKEKSFFGFIVDRPAVVTTFDEASDILQLLQNSNVGSIDCMLYYFSKNGTDASVPSSLKFDRAVGGNSGAARLCKQAGDKTRLYYQAEFVDISRASFGWWSWNSAATSVLRTNMIEYRFRQSTNTTDYKSPLSFYLAPNRLKSAAEDYANKLKLADNEGILFSGMGKKVYSDYGKKNPSSREDTAGVYQDAMDAVGQKTGNVSVDGPNAYSFGHAGLIGNVPVKSSNQECLSRSVPFYSIALHGLVDLSGLPLNGVEGSSQGLLELLTGVAPTYRMTGRNPNILQNTRLDFIFNTYYADWLDEAVSDYKRYETVHASLGGQFIIDYEQIGNLHVATYQDGTVIAVNPMDKDADFKGQTVPAGGYLLKANEI